MKHDEERIKKVATLYLKMMFAAFLVAIVVAYVMITVFFAEYGFIVAVIVAYATTATAVKIFQNMFKNHVRKNIYDGNMDAYDADMQRVILDSIGSNAATNEPQRENASLHLTILSKPEKPIAKYKDADIYEWMDFADENNNPQRFFYFGTSDLGKETVIPDGCILIQPGIIYRHHSLEG